jgi:hypothetical protein
MRERKGLHFPLSYTPKPMPCFDRLFLIRRREGESRDLFFAATPELSEPSKQYCAKIGPAGQLFFFFFTGPRRPASSASAAHCRSVSPSS